MTTPVGAPNYDQLRRCRSGLEIIRGTKATPTNPWYGMLALTRTQALADSNEYAGTFFQDYTPVRGAIDVAGPYQQNMSYEDPHLFRYAIKGGVTGTDDTNSVHGYTYDFTHTGSRDDLDTFSNEGGAPPMILEGQGLFFPEWTLSADIDDAQAVWKFSATAAGISLDRKAGLNDVAATSGTTTTFVKSAWGLTISAWVGGWVHFKTGTAGNIGLWREITANDATSLTFAAVTAAVTAADTVDVYAPYTAGISDRTREMIAAPGTTLYLDTGTIGTTLQSGRFISFSITSQINASYKRFLENTSTKSNKMDRGMVRVTGQVRLEFDRRQEWDAFTGLTAEKIRIKQTGSVIDSGAGTTKSITVDVLNAVFDSPTTDKRGNNVVATFPFRAYVDISAGYPLKVSVKNKQSVLLA
jgi:hypothetical protein